MLACKSSFVFCPLVITLLLPLCARGETSPALETLLSENTRLMIFSPHPDDETLGAGGLIQHVLRVGGAVKVVFMTSGDGYPEGVEMEDRISHPTAEDYRQYGMLRQEEARQVLATVGMKEKDVIFLGFPDGGLYTILSKYQSDDGPDYTSPFTLESRPPPADVVLPNTEYNSEDLKKEINRLLADFRPTLLATTHPRDQHPDHCSTYFFVWEALKELEQKDSALRSHLLTFLIHFGQWPMGEGAGTGSHLYPPKGFPEQAVEWISFPLSVGEVDTKRRALLQYHSQMLVMGRYLMSFARGNELFSLDQQRTEQEREELRRCGK